MQTQVWGARGGQRRLLRREGTCMESRRVRRNWVKLGVCRKDIQGRKTAMYEGPEEKVSAENRRTTPRLVLIFLTR